MNSINWSPKALKQVRKLDRKDGATITKAVDSLATFPHCQNVKALTNHEYEYRLRVGNYRVFFNFDGVVSVVSVEEVKKRDERTY
ncbi:cytotoxic translational repressor of toxin-antitoxin stability system [Burkholderia pseudomallei]|uniref:type II toxin-antitoxin system RelE family toxin n=1 Tax=Burkholderia pseudomallei TaxID=28450 RepID=UPI000055B5A7|nr:type II toxin-antitoxin system RelE/ParE family toxin [Burkholderia pseudomallei]AJX60266.1 plasmid stabilization system family protein [Burkholderia pseudomallei Pasteur 52237]EDO95486.1 possible bacteriophage protein [Burkholderia pseudomallei Pasteur 52237]MWA16559.1 type II toxin-antitoxin system RelE/ParE family toxin [Burkholderia pseudomallei]OND78990.1 cytotoxic translational repressor of toxin-antitoxin stability system [Burkholderia pseudomallei]VBQ81105.1 Plasmid stabilisation sy